MDCKHTPGPWDVATAPGSSGGIAHEFRFIAFTAIPGEINQDRLYGESWLDMRERTEPQRKAIKAEEVANARLIAAAPELLEACQLGHQDSTGLPAGDLLAAANVLRNEGHAELAASLGAKHAAECATIAKATGQTGA